VAEIKTDPAIAFLKSKWGDRSCPMCNKGPWSVQDRVFQLNEFQWDFLRKKIEELTTEHWFFHATGSMVLGAGLATLISIWTGAVVVSDSTPNALVIAWSVTAVCCICGLACLGFAHKERKVFRAKAGNVLTQMSLIELRFGPKHERQASEARLADEISA
jgi:hypothetical protein